MSKGKKTVLISAIICAALGLILCVVTLAVSGWRLVDKTRDIAGDISNVTINEIIDGISVRDTDNELNGGFAVAAFGVEDFDAAGIRHIEISAVADNVIILPVTGEDKITVEYPEKAAFDGGICGYTSEIKGDTLKINYFEADLLSLALGEDGDLKIWIPSTLFDTADINIDIVSGDVELSDLFGERLQVATVSGEVELNRCRFASLLLTSNSGGMELTDCDAETMKFESTSGDIEIGLAKAYTEYDVKINTVSGEVSGRMHTGGSKTVEVDTVSGDIELEYGA